MFPYRMTSVLISRFLLNLRQVGHSSGDLSNVRTSHIATLRFRIPETIVGNLGESLHVEDDVESSEDQEYDDSSRDIELVTNPAHLHG